VEHVVVVDVADVADRVANDQLVVDFGGSGDLARHYHLIGLNQRFASDTAVLVLREAGVEYAVGNKVGDFVGVTFTHRFGGEDEGVGHKEELVESIRQSDTQV